MLDIATPVLDRLRSGREVAVVTVTEVDRSAPRGVGASMAVTDAGEVIGSISGGCVEGDAIVLAHLVLADGAARGARFGFDDEAAHAAGLACGGRIGVLAYRIRRSDAAAFLALEEAAADRAVTVGIALEGAAAGSIVRSGDLASAPAPSLDAALDAAAILAETRVVRADDGQAVLALSRAPRPRLLVLGAGDHAAALCRVATAAGFAVTVCDVWDTLVTRERFPEAAELVAADPATYLRSQDADGVDARTAVCVLTHDTRLDIPAIRVALGMPVGFVGALGSRRTVAHRAALLREAGVGEDDLARLHSPLGLDLGGASPDEVAISALAEIVQSRHGASGRPLLERTGALHRGGAPEVDAPATSCSTGAETVAWI
ncbi:XdhC family protein [Microbacterium marinilacus]|uniref:XdhC family protein n=1 Tax=Microbacterium marinilacus TaxID=415209 RepID=A0ABP7BFE3_9MICO|nr:XdhC/CoxI family protein [Microbacterium marinilacus]MBY0688944.1 XdhC family protein [Microbacterium marinilacus]